MSDDHDVREVVIDSGGDAGERLQESIFAETMLAFGGVGGVAATTSFVFDRLEHRVDRDAELGALRAELEAQDEADRRALEIGYRSLYAQMYGLDALDRLDGFGPDDDCFGGFGVE